MDKQQIYDLAYRSEPMPHDADLLDCGLYYRLRELFGNFNQGIMPATVCSSVKADLFNAYDDRRLWERIQRETDKRRLKINLLLTEAKNNGCRYAEKIQDAFCGIGVTQ